MTNPTPTSGSGHAQQNGAEPRRGFLSREKLRLGIALTSMVIASGLIAWWCTRPVTLGQPEQVADALKLLDAGKFGQAHEIAKRLETQNYQHPGFAGVLKFIQGMAAFGSIEVLGERGEESQYTAIIESLRDAERLSLGKDRRAEWCYALGKSLYMAQESAAARPLLEEALETYPPCTVDASEMLVDLYLDPGIRSAELMRRALSLNDQVIESEGLDSQQLDSAYLKRAELYLATDQFDDATETLKLLSKPMAKSQLSQILQARILLARRQYAEAMAKLEPIALNDRIGHSHAQEACYLMGFAAEALWERERDPDHVPEVPGVNPEIYWRQAIDNFSRTARRYERTDEATAANLRLGRLWRLANGHENALECYDAALTALKPLQNVENFRNRWISPTQFRQGILEAWNGWVADQRFAEAIALSEKMTPLFPKEEAYEFAARVHQRWAESTEEELRHKPQAVRKARTEELRRRWQQSAQAFVKLAEVRVSSANYPEALWNAAEQFHRAHDFENALQLINQFLDTEPDRMLAAALVKRSRIELDLDHIAEALTDLQQVVRSYPTDPATFTAQYLIGVCHFEQNQLDEAEDAWSGILMSEQLSPSAVEWRDAQFSLGRLMFERGELHRRQIQSGATSSVDAVMEIYGDASSYWKEAARLLARHLERNQSGDGPTEARYYLGKALQREAEWLARQLEVAETDNARQQLESQHDAMLLKALKQFEQLRDELGGQNTDQIDDLQQRILKNCIFEIPHTYFDLREYDKAINHYNAAINRYPQDVQAMVAYLQMSQCHLRHKPPQTVESRNMLHQARLLLTHNHIPESEFKFQTTNLSRLEWEAWLERARQVQ